ncbi:MAG: hypothetical protein AAF223_04165, partial [Bacteroidota bacterium]
RGAQVTTIFRVYDIFLYLRKKSLVFPTQKIFYENVLQSTPSYPTEFSIFSSANTRPNRVANQYRLPEEYSR